MTRGGEEVMYHGPRLAAWVIARGVVPTRDLSSNLERAIRRWRSGERASERLVDELCCHMAWGSHLTAVPHDFIVKGRELVEAGLERREAA